MRNTVNILDLVVLDLAALWLEDAEMDCYVMGGSIEG